MFWYIVGSLIIIYVGFTIFSDKYSDWGTNTALFAFAIIGIVGLCLFWSLISSVIHEKQWTDLNTYTVAKVERTPVYAINGLLVYCSINGTRDVEAGSYIFADVEQPYLEKTIYSYDSFFVMPWMSTITKTVCYLPEKGI